MGPMDGNTFISLPHHHYQSNVQVFQQKKKVTYKCAAVNGNGPKWGNASPSKRDAIKRERKLCWRLETISNFIQVILNSILNEI